MADMKDRDYNEIHLVVTHPNLGMFIARKITDPDKVADDTYIDRTANSLQGELERKGGWEGHPPAVLCRRVKNEKLL
jgi:hypothetical protein